MKHNFPEDVAGVYIPSEGQQETSQPEVSHLWSFEVSGGSHEELCRSKRSQEPRFAPQQDFSDKSWA